MAGEERAMPKTLHDLLIDSLRDAYSTEQQLLSALPEMAKAAKTAALAKLFKDDIAATKAQIGRLCAIFEELGVAPEGKVSLPMEGIVTESQKLAAEGMPPEVLDAALVASAHKIAHYEMAAYSSLCGYAESLGLSKAAKALHVSLKEEKKFDSELTAIAKSKVNPRATKAA
jgi:ferritin-like metal-binding protein YciE